MAGKRGAMSWDVNEVCRLLGEQGITYRVSTTGQDVRWVADNGVQWAYFCRLHNSRESRLCAYGIDPEEAVERAAGRWNG